MARPHTILIADADVEVVRSLKRVLQDSYDVIVVKDGSKALEQSILRLPDLILFDRHCPLIGATQFVRILRSNPRTEEIPIIILSDVPMAAGQMPGFLQGVLVKPLNLDEVRSHVAAVLRKRDAVKTVEAEDGAVAGSLEQISMPDLLQIFSLNRRSGCLQLTSMRRETAEVFVHEGRIEEALVSGVRGEKALYRLLGWREGRFAFLPGRRAPSTSIASSTDSLLMEGMRQTDELERLASEVPSPAAMLERLVPSEALPDGLHPVTAEIVGLVEVYPRVGDLVDKAKASDLEVYLALRSLLQAGLVRAVEPGHAAPKEALLSADEGMELMGRLRCAGLAPTFSSTPKVALLSASVPVLRQVSQALLHLPGWQSGDLEQLYKFGMGPIGTLSLDGGLRVEFYAVGTDERMLPLVYALSAGTVAGLLLGTHEAPRLERAIRLVEQERRATLLIGRRPDEPPLSATSRRVEMVVDAIDDASVRNLVRTLLTQVAGRDELRGGTL